jgi:hypothetical protein
VLEKMGGWKQRSEGGEEEAMSQEGGWPVQA